MASVSRCDACGMVGKHEDYIIIKLFNENRLGASSTIICRVEVCPECYAKLKEILNLDGGE